MERQKESLKSHEVAYKKPIVFLLTGSCQLLSLQLYQTWSKNILEREMKYMFNYVFKLM